jgi:hypothetical protein
MVLLFTAVLCQNLAGALEKDPLEGYQYRRYVYFPCVHGSPVPLPETHPTVRDKGQAPPKIAVRRPKNAL